MSWVAVLAVAVVGCSRGQELPAADGLLRAAARELRGVETVGFDLEVEGPLGSPAIRRADGVANRMGETAGTVLLDEAGALIEYEVVISAGQVYLKGPTGGFQALPPAISASVYNPSVLLNPSGGIAAILATVTAARTEAAEAVNGTGAFRVSAMIDSAVLEQVLPVNLEEGEVPTELWIGQDRPHLLRVRLTAHVRGEDQPTSITVTLRDFNAPVDIAPPPA
ncbi:MAG: LppX_LprAFG lipoprotein [Egibacteraceae bacterium]